MDATNLTIDEIIDGLEALFQEVELRLAEDGTQPVALTCIRGAHELAE